MQAEDRIKELEEELQKTKYNKRTAKHIGLVKAKIARLKSSLRIASKKKGARIGFAVKKTGNATAVFIGQPSVGKSTLLNLLTNAESKVGSYDFTTLKVIPGMMKYKGALIQLLDIPGVVEGAAHGKGRGKEVMSVLRVADLMIIVVDNLSQVNVVKKELYESGIRLDMRRPAVSVSKRSHGGLDIILSLGVKFSEEEAKAVLTEYGVLNADVVVHGPVTLDGFIDVLEGNRKYVRYLVVLNKIDIKSPKKKGSFIGVSARLGTNIGLLREKLFSTLEFKRVYMKKIGQSPDKKEPLIVRGNVTVLDACAALHRGFENYFEYAKVWGRSARFPGQTVGAGHRLKDEDVLELHLKK